MPKKFRTVSKTRLARFKNNTYIHKPFEHRVSAGNL